jgi:predicted peroxiredoxin
MAGKVLVNLATGMEDPERVTVAFLVATAAVDRGNTVVVWATQEAVRLGLPGEAKGEACEGCPPLERLFQQFADGGGELWLCPICVNSRGSATGRRWTTSRSRARRRCWSGSETTRPPSATEGPHPPDGFSAPPHASGWTSSSVSENVHRCLHGSAHEYCRSPYS